MESDADMLRALVDAVNSLSSLNAKDGRILILQDAIKEIRGASRAASPSKGMKVTEKRRTLKGSKFIPKAKPTAKPKTKTAALLPAAKDDNAPIFSTLLNGLKNIASLLKNISTLLGVQLTFKRLLDARQRRRDALEAKRKREEGLEGSEKSGMGTKISSSIAKPMKSLWANLLNFFKNILLGSAVLGFYKWMKDPKNLETIKGIADWFSKYGKAVIFGIGTLLALRVGFRLYRLYRGVKSLLGKIGQLGRGGRPSNLVDDVGSSLLKGRKFKGVTTSGGKLVTGSKILEETLEEGRKRVIKKTVGKSLVTVGGNVITEGAGGKVAGSFSSPTVGTDPKLLKGPRTPKQIEEMLNLPKGKTKIIRNISKTDVPNILDTGKGGQSAASFFDNMPKDLQKLVSGELTSEALDLQTVFNRSAAKDIPVEKVGIFKKMSESLKGSYDNISGKLGTQYSKILNRFMSKATQEGAEKILSRGLPVVGGVLDSASAKDEFSRGNITAGSLFGLGAATSFMSAAALSFGVTAPFAGPLSGLSLAFSILGIGASVIEDSVKGRYGGSIEATKEPTYIPPNKRRNKNNKSINLSSNNKTLSSGSGATSSDVASVGTTHLEHLSHIKGVERDLNLSLA
jgi:hypothetical protein